MFGQAIVWVPSLIAEAVRVFANALRRKPGAAEYASAAADWAEAMASGNIEEAQRIHTRAITSAKYDAIRRAKRGSENR